MLTLLEGHAHRAVLRFEPAREGVPSWNTYAACGALRFRLLRAGVPSTPWLPFAEWTATGRTSHSPAHGQVRVETDVIRSTELFDGIELEAGGVEFKAAAFATPVPQRPSLPYARSAFILDVPCKSQYGEWNERGWCSPASLAMIHAYHGIDEPVEKVAAGVFDRAYNGTGNWTFNAVYSGSLGFRAAVVYLRNLDHAQLLIERNLPIAISYGWREGELPGAPIPHSDGHLAVLCGFASNGDCAINDPAAEGVRAMYPRTAIERLWQRAGGIAYVVAPVGIDFADAVNG